MTDRIDRQGFLRRVCELTGISDRADAARVADVVSVALLEQLPVADRRRLSAALEAAFPASLHPERSATDQLPEFYARIADGQIAGRGRAREHTQAICRAIAEGLEPSMRPWLIAHLPDALAELFQLSDAHPPMPHVAPHRSSVPAPRQTLSEGRPGSQRPLSEARGDRTQTESVATPNPHGDSKLSSAHGLTQDREDESLSSGRPGSHGAQREPD